MGIREDFMALRPEGGFRTIAADPPWAFENFSAKGAEKNATAHYDCMSIDAICALPVPYLAADDAVLFMWATWAMLPEAMRVVDAWGFAHKSGGAWGKMTSKGNVAFGTGYWFRSASEPMLLATRGNPAPGNRKTRNLWLEERREHSRKPEAVKDLMTSLGHGPRIELFAREPRDGWTVWGNQTDKFATQHS